MPAHPPLSLPNWIAACARRSLRGHMPAPLREYSFSFDELAKRITLKAEVERELTEEERESLAIAEAELYADRIFDDDTLIETKVEVAPEGTPLRPLPGGVIFSRDAKHVEFSG